MREDAGQIVVSGLTKRFGGVTAVDDLSFIAAPGSVTGFLGPNGAGKTTTLRMLAGLVAPDAGTATIGGRNYSALPFPGRAAGVVLEAAGFHPARTGRDHLRVYCTACGYPPGRADEVLELTGLDPEGIAWLRGLLRAAARVGRTVLYSSHALPEVEQLADQVVIISRGKLVRQGTLAELTGDRGGLEQVFLSLTAGSADPRSKRTGGHDAPCRG